MGSTRVIAYTSPFGLDQLPEVAPENPWVHFCATPSLKSGMLRRYKHLDGHLFSVREITDHLLNEWSGSAVRLEQFALLTKLIEEMRRKHGHKDKELDARLRAFRRNQKDVLNGIRDLVECGLRPAEMKPSGPDESLFQTLWSHMEANDEAIASVRRQLFVDFERPALFAKALSTAIANAAQEQAELRRGRSGTNEQPAPSAKVVLHGYYFITPLQHRLFKLMENAGFDLLFLNCYDSRYPTTFSSWKAFFNSDTGLPTTDTWTILASTDEPAAPGQVFGDLTEGRIPPCLGGEGHLRLLRFPDFGSFLERFQSDVPQNEQTPGTVYFSPEARQVTRFLREYYAPIGDRHLLSYPVGQLLFHLHQMWDEFEGRLVVSERAVFECFASGWLQKDGLNGRDYLRPLQAVLPFFQGLESLTDWSARARLLQAARDQVVDRFNTPRPPSDPNHRFHQLLSNPFERVAHFQVSSQTVGEIALLMQQLFDLANELFRHGETSIAAHFKRIESLLTDGIDDRALLHVEKSLLRNLRERLHREHSTLSFAPQDLAQAVAFFFGGDLLNEGDDEDSEFSQHLVSRLDRLDGAPLAHPRQGIHLCLLGEKSLPRHKPAFSWPLSARAFAHLPQPNVGLRLLALREQESKSSDRYLLFLALAWCERVTLSWIEDWQEEKVGPSPLLVLMKTQFPLFEVQIEGWNQASKTPPQVLPCLKVSTPDAYETLPPDALAEYALCPRRFFYSFLTRSQPAFTDDFHHQFLFGALVNGLHVTAGYDRAKVAEEVSKLFPQWHDLQRRDLLERSRPLGQEWDLYQGTDYPEGRYAAQFLTLSKREEMDGADEVLRVPKARADVLMRLSADLGSEGIRPAPDAGHRCRYCPHNAICDAAHYPADDEEE